MLDLSCVIVSWNSAAFLKRCLESLPEGIGPHRYEVFVVDNASTDGSADLVRTQFPSVHLVANTENVGFSRANNQALQRCTGRKLLLLNPDTCVQKGAVDRMIRHMDAHPEVGVLGARLAYPDGTYQRCAAGHFLDLKTALVEYFGLYLVSPRKHPWKNFVLCCDIQEMMDMDWVSAAAMLVRRESLLQAGPMNEDYFLYGEDVEWCGRIKAAGWTVRYFPQATVIHDSGQSVKLQQDEVLFRSARWLENWTRASGSRIPLGLMKGIVLCGLAGRIAGHSLIFVLTRNRRHWEHTRAGWKMLFLVR